MSTYVKAVEVPRLLDLNDQVLTKKDWLPAGVFPELDELREEHHELVAELDNAAHLSHRLRKRYEQEDEARQEAAVAGEDPPPVTGSADRKDALEDVRVLIQARIDRLAAFVERAIGVINEKYGEAPEFPDEPGLVLPEWRQGFAMRRAEVDTEVEAAKEALRAAERKEAAIKGDQRWLDMTIRAKGGIYMASTQGSPARTREEWGADKVPPSMSGMGMVN